MKFSVTKQRKEKMSYPAKLWSRVVVLLLMITLMVFTSQNMAWSQGQRKVIKGHITNEKREPAVGASIVVKGTTIGTTTDASGDFTMSAASNAVLVISFVGYEPQEINVANNTIINAQLLLSANSMLDQVIVIGYGTQKKKDVTGSVVSISGDRMNEIPAANITRALQGRVAGVEMSQTDTKPGASMQIRIRGTRSLNASNDPLIVLDGIPFGGSIGDIDPNDIKSVDILKDASATAIYGSRGANGVILVSTNKGQTGQKAHLTYNGYVGLKKVFAQYPMMNGPEFVAIRKAAKLYTPGLDEADSVNTNWQDLLYRNAMETSQNIGITGGSEKGNYSVGMGYFRDESVIPLQNFNRYSLRSSLDQRIGKLFSFGITTNNNYTITNGNNLGMYTNLSSSPISNPYNKDGTLKRTVKMSLDENWTFTKKSLNSLGDSYIDQTRALSSYNALYGEMKIPGVEGLKYRVNVGLNYRQSNYGNYTGVGVYSATATAVSTASITNSHTTNWAIENLLTYDRTFAKKHKISAVAMYSSEQSTYWSSNVSAMDIPSDAFQFYNIGRANGTITVNPDNQGYTQSGLESFMGRVMYSYNNKYMLSATFRSDASSRLAPGHQWNSYPAVSAGWNIKDESFMKNVSLVDALKLRVGYGQTSNQSVDPYKTLGLLSSRPYNFGTTTTTGLYVSQLPNPALGWEFSKTWNFGVDFSLLKSRLTGTVEYYIQKTDNVLLGVSLPATSGVSSYTANIGATQNKGIELSLNAVILDNLNGFTWEAGVNVYRNRNKLVQLASGSMKDEGNLWFVGHPIDVIFDYKNIGLWKTSADSAANHLNTLYPGGNVGMIKVAYTGTYNTDGTPTRALAAADRQVMDIQPDFEGGFNTRVGYKGFELSVVGTFKSGGILNSTLYGSTGYLNMLNGRRGQVKADYWTATNTNAKYPKPGGSGSDAPTYGTTLGYFNASYLKIRTITLGYNFTQKWMKNAGIDRMRFYCTLENPFVLFSPYNKESHQDPEPNSYGDQNVAVTGTHRLLVVGTNTPVTRNYLVGFNVTF